MKRNSAANDKVATQQQQQQQSRRVKRPKPSPLSIIPDLIRLFFQAFWTLMFHHFVTTTLLAPWLFNMIKGSSSFILSFIQANTVMNFLSSKVFMPSLEPRGYEFSDVVLFSLGTTIVHALAYVVINGFFAALDIYGLLQQYRIPMEPRMKITPALIKQTLFNITKTLLVTGPIGLGFLFMASKWKPVRTVDDLVTWNEPIYHQFFKFWMCIVFNHVAFYWAHRLFHHPALYAKFPFNHNKHHEYINSISISAEHASVSEQIGANFFPTYGMILVLSDRVPMSVWFTWLIWRLLETFEAHSGYDFRGTLLQQIGFLQGTAYWHCYHHSNWLPTFSSCYGQYYLDYIFDTCDAWLMDDRLPCAPAQTTELDWK